MKLPQDVISYNYKQKHSETTNYCQSSWSRKKKSYNCLYPTVGKIPLKLLSSDGELDRIKIKQYNTIQIQNKNL